jgi:hypothetical protein
VAKRGGKPFQTINRHMYQLQQLETILKEKKKPSPATLIAEQQTIEQGWLEYLYASHPFERLQIYVSQHAKALMTIMDSDKSGDVVNTSQQLFSFLHKHGAPYWDHHLPVPDFI